VPLYNLMEDAATAEICRAQLWQWLRFAAPLDDGRALTPDLFAALLGEETAPLAAIPRIGEARRLLEDLVRAEDFEEFLTIPAYPLID
jgi:malate synthase